MSDEFRKMFGYVELGPQDHPEYGRVLYERSGSGLAKRYTLDGGHAIDVRTGERAFRLGDDGRVILPNGLEVAGPRPLAKAADVERRLYAPPPPKQGSPFGAFKNAPAARAASAAQPSSTAQRMFGRR